MTTFTLYNNVNVAAGTTTSQPLDMSTINPPPTKFMRFNALLSPTDLADPTLTLTAKLQGLFNGVWVDQVDMGDGWRGGTKDRTGNLIGPFLEYEPSAGLFPPQLRAIITLSSRTRMTITVDVE